MSTPVTTGVESEDTQGFFSNYAAQAKIYARSVSGRYAKLRWAAVFFTQLLFYGIPWLQWNGRQAVLFDLGARKFYLFGVVLWPQDFIFLAGLLVIAALSLFFFTALAGRLWCGYACPQTVYTELFMWIERQIEGDRNARQKLDRSPMSARKLRLKTSKHLAWIILALWTGLTFIGYFAPIRQLGADVASLTLGPWQWFWWLFYSFATWGNAGFMREQVCKYMCPYARFQGAMFDKDTLIVTYDKDRGDPRGSRPRKAEPAKLGLGDCVDCGLCVQVCPTGIDIRNGLQYECIGCAACIDVCNGVMDKMGYAQGLVRYSTDHAMTNKLDDKATLKRVLRPRTLIYGAILTALVVALLTALAMRNPIKVDVVRDRGAIARIAEGGKLENTYRLQFINATEEPVRLKVGVAGIDGLSFAGESIYEVGAASNRVAAASVRLNPGVAASGSHPFQFVITRVDAGGMPIEGEREMREKGVFLVPR